ncbi:unnamed protein product [Chondrus crispus]|uniref:Uncharacterized protein n=1 Tax=Chondrus crispus TaxID=2769 RepID=R7QGL3_CHOCR|nr:unnamed protein product [Chondrus crispus]CDF36540.1 unnamed protein product [Chondrus crispus]|eukprot:XP_005716359.1 unnamed protein product [Chondrus crispus]
MWASFLSCPSKLADRFSPRRCPTSPPAHSAHDSTWGDLQAGYVPSGVRALREGTVLVSPYGFRCSTVLYYRWTGQAPGVQHCIIRLPGVPCSSRCWRRILVRVAIRRIGPARSSAPRRLALAPSHFCPWCWVHDSARLVCRVVAHF